MSRRRIVLVDQYFPPDTAATARIVDDFAEACRNRGAPLTVVCGYPSYDAPTRPAWRPVRIVRAAGITRYVVGSTGFDRRSGVGRAANYLTFMLGAALLIPLVTARAAFVVMTDPPMAPLLAWWAKRVGRPQSVTIWVQDLHPDFGVAAGLLRAGVGVRLWRRALAAALRCADEVVVLGRDMERRVCAVADVPTRVVHNGWSGVTPAAARASDAERPLRVMHFGNLGFAGPWSSVLEAAGALGGVAEFVFVGGGAAEGEFRAAPPNVSLVGRMPHEQVPALAAEADLLLVGTRRGIEGFVVPSKGYEMMALARPLLVVAAPEAEMRRIVEERRCGVAIDDDPAAIVCALKGLDRASLAAMAERARASASDFSRAGQFGVFIDTLSPA
ncbi:MAG TPA: glycosyltransferase family 4 protein [Acidimicrobiales bacterium]|nr:glycosyltransferase family 4 protein [Acidimicrobiales bacterium]